MKNTFSSIKKHLMLKYTLEDENMKIQSQQTLIYC